MTIKPSVQLDDRSAAFVGEQVDSGRYGSPVEVVRAGLRLLEAEALRARELESALIAGEQSGEPVSFDFDAFKAGKRAAYRAG